MNKLQLYIAKSLRGYKSLVNFNPEEDVQRCVADLRDVLAGVDYNSLEKNIFYLIQYIRQGTLFSILRTIPTEPLDHLAATIFIPAAMNISADELASVVRAITRKMSAPSMTSDDIADLRRLFAKEYTLLPEAERGEIVPSAAGAAYACAYYGGDSARRVADYLGPRIYQPAWLPYGGVLLLDADMGLPTDLPDLTELPLDTTTPLLPPERGESEFEPHIFGRQFDRPFLVPLGGKVEIVWTRPGFEPRKSIMTVNRPRMTATATATDDARKTLSPDSFVVSSLPDRMPIERYTVQVNGTVIDGEHSFTETELENAHVVVTAPGFNSYSGRINLAGSTVAHIRLSSTGKTYRFQLPVRSAELGAPVSFEIHTKQSLTESPIEGYEALDTIREGAGRTNMLAYAGAAGGSMRRLLIAAAIGLVVGIVLGFCLFAGSPDEKINRPDSARAEVIAPPVPVPQTVPEATPAADPAPQPVQQPAAEPVPVAATNESLSEAIKYLDSNRTWHRAEMEKFAVLSGLFDDMNALSIERLKNHWGEKLKDSKNFGAIVRAADGCIRKKVNVHRDNRTTYNKPGDEAIGYVGYTYWIDP